MENENLKNKIKILAVIIPFLSLVLVILLIVLFIKNSHYTNSKKQCDYTVVKVIEKNVIPGYCYPSICFPEQYNVVLLDINNSNIYNTYYDYLTFSSLDFNTTYKFCSKHYEVFF